MKINKELRNLIMRQPGTVMISTKSCKYLGKKYIFAPVTKEEVYESIGGLLKILYKRPWAENLMYRLFGDNK